MNMDKATADRWVTIAAAIVAGVYFYRRVTEPAAGPTTAKKLVGIGQPVPLGSFVTAWGFMFLVLSIVAEASPGLGGSFSALIATSDLLTNMPAITADVGKRTGAAKPAATATATTSSSSPPATTTSTGSLPTAPFAAGGGGLDPLAPTVGGPPTVLDPIPIPFVPLPILNLPPLTDYPGSPLAGYPGPH